MNGNGIVPSYIRWHYGDALGRIFALWTNFLWFAYTFFSIPLLMRSLFSPWQRIQEEYKKGFDIEAYASSFLVNILMRCVGAFVRIIFIVVGTLSLLLLFGFGLILFVLWFLLPLVVLGLAFWGIRDFGISL